jgi:hypothetical protein
VIDHGQGNAGVATTGAVTISRTNLRFNDLLQLDNVVVALLEFMTEVFDLVLSFGPLSLQFTNIFAVLIEKLGVRLLRHEKILNIRLMSVRHFATSACFFRSEGRSNGYTQSGDMCVFLFQNAHPGLIIFTALGLGSIKITKELLLARCP